jgi:hypothetical protein
MVAVVSKTLPLARFADALRLLRDPKAIGVSSC